MLLDRFGTGQLVFTETDRFLQAHGRLTGRRSQSDMQRLIGQFLQQRQNFNDSRGFASAWAAGDDAESLPGRHFGGFPLPIYFIDKLGKITIQSRREWLNRIAYMNHSLNLLRQALLVSPITLQVQPILLQHQRPDTGCRGQSRSQY